MGTLPAGGARLGSLIPSMPVTLEQCLIVYLDPLVPFDSLI